VREDEELLLSYGEMSLAEVLQGGASSWARRALSDPGALAGAALREAAYADRADDPFAECGRLAQLFFRGTAEAMAASALVQGAEGDFLGGDFLTLDALDAADTLNAAASPADSARLAALADAAESEAGQQVIRDMVLSFRLPSATVGVRRTLLLARAAAAAATKSHTDTLNECHNLAMRGAAWTFASDEDPLHRMCAVLAGMAVILAKNSEAIRKGAAFGGRVQLPFLSPPPPTDGSSVLSLLPASNTWVVFSIVHDRPRVRMRAHGVDGFFACALLFSKSLRC
jgi:hypothetical protein